MTRKDVTVQIMLGGKSTRMGTDKALVKLGGKTLLERAVECWRGFLLWQMFTRTGGPWVDFMPACLPVQRNISC